MRKEAIPQATYTRKNGVGVGVADAVAVAVASAVIVVVDVVIVVAVAVVVVVDCQTFGIYHTPNHSRTHMPIRQSEQAQGRNSISITYE